jgi:hypothetical protein
MKTPFFAIVTSRGGLKAGWIVPVHPEGSARYEPCHTERPSQIHWIENFAFVLPHQHLSEQLSDMAGAYAATATSGGKPSLLGASPSETHWRIEADRRTVRDLAAHIHRMLQNQKPERWVLSAPADLHRALVEELPKVCRDHLIKVVAANLYDATPEDLLGHFEEVPV